MPTCVVNVREKKKDVCVNVFNNIFCTCMYAYVYIFSGMTMNIRLKPHSDITSQSNVM